MPVDVIAIDAQPSGELGDRHELELTRTLGDVRNVRFRGIDGHMRPLFEETLAVRERRPTAGAALPAADGGAFARRLCVVRLARGGRRPRHCRPAARPRSAPPRPRCHSAPRLARATTLSGQMFRSFSVTRQRARARALTTALEKRHARSRTSSRRGDRPLPAQAAPSASAIAPSTPARAPNAGGVT